MSGNGQLIEAISGHIERHVGPIARVWHELVSDDLHIDVHHVDPAPHRPFHALVTSGMSEFPMSVPAQRESFRFAELAILLPQHWLVTEKDFEDEKNYWPLRLLKRMARYPHENHTWLGYGHTVANQGEPPAPFASNTALNAIITLPALSLVEAFWKLERPRAPVINFWMVVPLYWEELQLKLRAGTDALLAALEQHAVTEIIDPSRANAALPYAP